MSRRTLSDGLAGRLRRWLGLGPSVPAAPPHPPPAVDFWPKRPPAAPDPPPTPAAAPVAPAIVAPAIAAPAIAAPAMAAGRDAAPTITWPEDDALMLGFESLGDNCEFGVVQRYFGAEPLGLLRFSWTGYDSLLQGLETGFDGIDQPDRIEIYLAEDGEFMVRLHPFRLQYHTFLRPPAMTAEKLRAMEVRRVGFLRRKFFEDLAEGTRIVVRKQNDAQPPERMHRLAAALRRRGRAPLLWVAADGAREPGTVEVIEPGLLRGTVAAFAPYDDAPRSDMVDWLRVCRGAWLLHREAAPPGTTILAAASAPPRPNLVPEAESAAPAVWVAGHHMTTAPAPARLHPAAEVARHVIGPDAAGVPYVSHGRRVEQGLEPGAIHVASAHVWIPDDFRGRAIGLMIDGHPSLRIANARLDVRGEWQRIWVSARLAAGTGAATLALYVEGEPGAMFYSTCWRFERGALPATIEQAES